MLRLAAKPGLLWSCGRHGRAVPGRWGDPYFVPADTHLVPDAKAIRECDGQSMSATTDEQDEVVGTSPNELREQALAQVKKRRDLKAHAVVYTLFNLAIWGIWAVVAANSHSWWPWPVFLTVFWGIGLAMNAWDVYFRKPITEQELQREIDRLDDERQSRTRR